MKVIAPLETQLVSGGITDYQTSYIITLLVAGTLEGTFGAQMKMLGFFKDTGFLTPIIQAGAKAAFYYVGYEVSNKVMASDSE